MDALDRQILQALATDARVPISTIAKDLGVANATVHQRYKRMKDNGTIRGFRLKLDFNQVGFPVTAVVSVSLVSDFSLGDMADILHTIPFVDSCFSVTGEFDLLMVVRARSSEHLGTILDDIRLKAQGSTRTLVVMSSHFHSDYRDLLGELEDDEA
jgi:Lrp/AsnC family transcriptional regulator, leucine-responsive regulatory protein